MFLRYDYRSPFWLSTGQGRSPDPACLPDAFLSRQGSAPDRRVPGRVRSPPHRILFTSSLATITTRTLVSHTQPPHPSWSSYRLFLINTPITPFKIPPPATMVSPPGPSPMATPLPSTPEEVDEDQQLNEVDHKLAAVGTGGARANAQVSVDLVGGCDHAGGLHPSWGRWRKRGGGGTWAR